MKVVNECGVKVFHRSKRKSQEDEFTAVWVVERDLLGEGKEKGRRRRRSKRNTKGREVDETRRR